MRHSLFLPFAASTLLVFFSLVPSFVHGGILPSDLVRNGGYIISRNGTVLEQYRPKELFQTASTIKLLTALVVLDTLGEDHRFTTEFYLDDNDILYVRGSGDPFLTSEYLRIIAEDIRADGVRRIRGYVLDGSFFDLEHPLPDGSENSDNPYDAPNGGLAVNFNSVSIIKKANGEAGTGEPQTPTLPITLEIAQQLQPGRHRININHYPVTGATSPQLRYTAEVLHELLTRSGIESTPAIRQGTVPRQAKRIYVFTSPKNVREVIRACLHFSNNFIANQLVLTAAAARYGAPATWGKAQDLLNSYAEETLYIPADQIQVVEGSGLSRDNMMTPEAMLTLLEKFHPYRYLLPLKKGALLKSGTMKSVYCYAGYLEKQEANTSFVFLLNQKENTRSTLLNELKKNI